MTGTLAQSHRGNAAFESGGRSLRDVLPLVAIAGSRGKSTVAWMIERILVTSGRSVGSWLSSGVYVDHERLAGELGPWSRVLLAARHGELNVALHELEAPTVNAAGLPPAAYPLALLTTLCGNHDACLIADETAAVRRSLAVVLRAVRDDGTLVVNADDTALLALVENHLQANPHIDQSETLVLVALHPRNPALRRHVAAGGRGMWVEQGWIMTGHGEFSERVVMVDDIPATLRGALIVQVQNAMVAVAGALDIGADVSTIAHALRGYAPDPAVQPAAGNVVEYNGATIVIDEPRRIWTLRMLARGVRHHIRRRAMVVSGSFPLLRDDELEDAGRVLGGLGAIVVLHDGSGSDDRLRRIKAGIASTPHPPVVLTLPNELRAIDHMLNSLSEGDIALVLAGNPETTLDHLWPAPKISAHRRESSMYQNGNAR